MPTNGNGVCGMLCRISYSGPAQVSFTVHGMCFIGYTKMRTNNYIIEYTCWGHDGVVLSTGLMRVKNRINTIDAREYFVKYLVKRYGNYGELQIKGCWMAHARAPSNRLSLKWGAAARNSRNRICRK